MGASFGQVTAFFQREFTRRREDPKRNAIATASISLRCATHRDALRIQNVRRRFEGLEFSGRAAAASAKATGTAFPDLTVKGWFVRAAIALRTLAGRRAVG